jgi:hypothetical protein
MGSKPAQLQIYGFYCLLTCCVLGSASAQQRAEGATRTKDSLQALGGAELRYAGPRWSLLYGSYEGVEEFAVNELERMVQRHVPYVLEVQPGSQTPIATRSLILVGTPAMNPKIAELGRRGLVKLPTLAQGYTLACLKSPWAPETRVVMVAGTDPPGVLYGVEEFNKRLATMSTQERNLRQALDAMPEFSLTEAPAIENRGLWTWGYVIYDYRRYFDNMARLKMNRLVVWNDAPPVNCRQFIEYAHSRGIKVILGFHWGWGLGKLDPTNPEHVRLVREDVLRKYEEFYRNLGMDGVYFQTFTEQSNTRIEGRTIASLACDWVNDIARALLGKHPDLRIECGLHATSIMENYVDLKRLDPRLTIVWEDAGDLPYSYDPDVAFSEGKLPRGLNTLDATIDYSKKLATFRPGSEFAMCAKGWTTLRWESEFEHHGPFIIGERAHEFIYDRLEERQPRWDYVNAKWAENYPAALRFYREIRNATSAPMSVVGLIEDGLFEERIQMSAALLGEMLWNPRRDEKDILHAALSPYYRIVQ